MRLVFFVPRLENCGPLNVVLNIVEELSINPEISITIVSLRDKRLENNNDYIDLFRKAGAKNFISLSDSKTLIAKLIDLRKLTNEADLIHSHGFFPDLLSSLLPSNTFKVSTTHCIIFEDYQLTYGKLKGKLYALLHHLVYLHPSFNFIVGCSTEVTNYLKRTNLFNKEKIVAIQNGVNTKYYHPLTMEEKLYYKTQFLIKLRKKYDVNSDIYLYSGNLSRRKRVPELINWFCQLTKSQKEDSILIILGDGEEAEICKKAAQGYENILFMGFIDNPIPYYQISDFLVSNSSLEGFPMSVLEGMSCGCKALLSDIPAHIEVIDHFPSMAMLLSQDFLSLKSMKPNELEFNYLSSSRMSGQYLNIYQKSHIKNLD